MHISHKILDCYIFTALCTYVRILHTCTYVHMYFMHKDPYADV